jgi:6-phosphofructokinase
LASGGDIILIPEIPYDIEAVCDQVKLRKSQGKNFSIVVVGEGAKALGGQMVVSRTVKNSPDAIRLGGISNRLSAQLEGLLNVECRVTILGHLVRGGVPSAFDRLLATQLGVHAVHLAMAGEVGRMVSWQNNLATSVPLESVAGKMRLVTPEHAWVKTAESMGICLGTPAGIPIKDYLAETVSR